MQPQIILLSKKISPSLLSDLTAEIFNSFVKIVVDVDRKMLAVGGEMHADAEQLLLENGSKQSNLWGANFYPFEPVELRVEYTSFINIRPRDGNTSMMVEDEATRAQIKSLCSELLLGDDDDLA
ncbi:MAG: DUF5674 family protein [Candidatus Marinimicrobia bacterium]|nr:DUF5674 family protein [Candidatus Neomarinimicrobiota bacterium]MCF7922311.1 DUF5674 family protein [Candidatus Neomarinimicrobiota bacterium]